MSNEFNYNYVFFDGSGSYFRIARSDLDNFPGCIVRESGRLPQASGVEQFLFKVHTSGHFSKDNRVIPFQNIWNKAYIGNLVFPEEKPICFIFATALATYYGMGLFENLRKNYPDCRIVLMLRDVVRVCLNRSGGKTLQDLWATFDRIYTINSNDVREYGFHPINVMCSRYSIGLPDKHTSDIVFVGKIKDRYDTIKKIYKRLSDAGVICDFTLLTDDNEMNIDDGIKTISHPMNYEDMLKKTIQSRCILEVTQKGIDSLSSRCLEALCYNKKLVTDVKSVSSMKYYNPQFMLIYEEPEEINPDFIKADIDVDYMYDDYYSPINLLQYIDHDLTQL